MHGRSLTESIRFEVTLEVNMLRDKKEFGSRVLEVPSYGIDVADVKSRGKIKVVKSYVKFQDSRVS